ncbi:MAG: ABC transporter substrate-binding protein [Gloeocapsa sp. DLM2.Bin57]|nr:MAG: ABC transporter substrate-binding protein [Gloeocapsa sp. DLM2.Bin57]
MKLAKLFLLILLVIILLRVSTIPLNASTPVIKGEIRVGVKNNSRPLAFLDESGELQGLEIDIAKNLAKELLQDETAVTFVPVTNQERLDALLNNQVDIVIARLTANAARSQLVNFSTYYYLDGTGVITKDPSINSIQDLSTARIAVLSGSDSIEIIRSRLPTAELVGVDSYQEAYELLEASEAIAFGADQSILTGWVQEYPEYRLIAQSLSGEPLAIAIPKGLQYVSLHNQINKAIAKWRDSGWLRERANYWGLP